MKHVIRVFKWVLILIVVFGLAFLIYLVVKINQPLKTQAQAREFVVVPGQTTKQVAQNLEAQEFINQQLFFRLYVHFKKVGGKIQAGTYLFSPAMSIHKIADVLIAGDVVDKSVKFTVVEGWDAADIGDALAALKIVNKKTFLQAVTPSPFSAKDFAFLESLPRGRGLEGFLFPDTYFVAPDNKAPDIVKKMLANFDRKLTPAMRQQIKAQNQSIYEIVTLASIIEREVGRNLKKGEKLSPEDLAKLQEERRIVAGIFYNRLRIGMALESDATVNYITGSKQNRASLTDIKIDSPYNTYKYRGLPPGPIANPSIDAILAAISPAKTDYLYFVTAPDGTAYFGKTLQEHNANKQKYLQ